MKKIIVILGGIVILIGACILLTNFILEKDTEVDTPLEQTDREEIKTEVINNGERAVEYGGYMYLNKLSAEEPYYEESTVCKIDLKNFEQTELFRTYWQDNINIYNNVLYTSKKAMNLTTNEITTFELPLSYIDDEITVYINEKTDVNYIFNTKDNKYIKDKEIANFSGTFVKRVDNIIYFYEKSDTKISLYSLNLTTNEKICLDTNEIKDDVLNEWSIISDLEVVDDTVVYSAGSYQGSMANWFAKIIKVNSDGTNKEIISEGDTFETLHADNENVYYGYFSSDGLTWMSYSIIGGEEKKIEEDTYKKLGLNNYHAKEIDDAIWLVDLGMNNTKKKIAQITEDVKDFYVLEKNIEFSNYYIVYLEYRDYSDGPRIGNQSVKIYHINKDGNNVVKLN